MAAALAGSLQSCLREKSCPPSAPARLFALVGEKNYANVGEIPQAQPVDENLPMLAFVAWLNVDYRTPDGGGSLLSRPIVPQPGETTTVLPAEELPAGSYEIVVAGNASDDNFVAGEEYLIALHPAGGESNDIYLANTTADFPLRAERAIPLMRTKGLLLLYYQTLPPEIERIGLTAQGVSEYVDARMNYSGTTTVNTEAPAPAGPAVVNMRLAPTFGADNPLLTITLKDANGDPVRTLSNIPLPIDRNRITAVELRYEPEDRWEIWITLDAEWVQVHQLTIR